MNEYGELLGDGLAVILRGLNGSAEVVLREVLGSEFFHSIGRFLLDARESGGPVDHYTLLGLSPKAATPIVKAAHKALVKQFHQDKFMGKNYEPLAEALSKILNRGRDVLVNATEREEYNSFLEERKAGTQEPFPDDPPPEPPGADPPQEQNAAGTEFATRLGQHGNHVRVETLAEARARACVRSLGKRVICYVCRRRHGGDWIVVGRFRNGKNHAPGGGGGRQAGRRTRFCYQIGYGNHRTVSSRGEATRLAKLRSRTSSRNRTVRACERVGDSWQVFARFRNGEQIR